MRTISTFFIFNEVVFLGKTNEFIRTSNNAMYNYYLGSVITIRLLQFICHQILKKSNISFELHWFIFFFLYLRLIPFVNHWKWIWCSKASLTFLNKRKKTIKNVRLFYRHRLLQELHSQLQSSKYQNRLHIKTFKFHNPPVKANCVVWFGGIFIMLVL